MEQSLSWKADRSSSTQGIPRILWKPTVQYSIHKRLQTVPVLGQINPVHASPSHVWKIHILVRSQNFESDY
jgi:hypothetical protein